jgi:hypothetical protein
LLGCAGAAGLKRGLGFNHGEAQPRKGEKEKIRPVLHGFSHISIFYTTADSGAQLGNDREAYDTLDLP